MTGTIYKEGLPLGLGILFTIEQLDEFDMLLAELGESQPDNMLAGIQFEREVQERLVSDAMDMALGDTFLGTIH